MAELEKQFDSDNQRLEQQELSPQDKLRQLVDKRQVSSSTDHRIGLIEDKDGKNKLVFQSTEGDQVVSIETRIGREEFEQILSGMIPLEETQFMMYELAKAYHQRTPIMFEGGTALGKTFVVNSFAKLLYGKKAIIPDFYCNGQTDVSELMGKYVPAGLSQLDRKTIHDYLQSDAGATLKAELKKEGNGSYRHQELLERAAAQCNITLDRNGFEFQLGVLPKAMTADFDEAGNLIYHPDGRGVMLHVQEAGMADPSVINSLLKTRGERGMTAAAIQLWEDGGTPVSAGEGFFIVYSTNPSESGYLSRSAIDPALARALVWKRLPEQLSEESLRKATQQIFRFDKIPAGEDTVINLKQHPELAQAMGSAMAKYHRIHEDMLKGGKQGRRQKIPATMDSLWRVAKLVQTVQCLKDDHSSVDMVATLRGAVKAIYIDPLQAAGSLRQQLLESFEQVLDNETMRVKFRNTTVSPRQQIEILTQEAMDDGGQTSSDEAARARVQELQDELHLAAIQEQLLKLRETLAATVFQDLKNSIFEKLSDKQRNQVASALEDKNRESLH